MPIRPMLAESIEVSALEPYLTMDQWQMQPKLDGNRMLVVITDGNLEVLNRAGVAKVSNVPYEVVNQFAPFLTEKGLWVFDGEVVEGNTLHLFDMASAGNHIVPLSGGLDKFSHRYNVLETLFGLWNPAPCVQLVPLAKTEAEKRAMFKDANDNHREGVMLRQVDGLYQQARRSKQLLKVKFTKDADVIILSIGHEGKDNATLGLLDPVNNRVVEVGRASTIGKRPKPEPGQVWCVRYLYVVEPNAPRLYQPRLMNIRTDKEMSECLFDQLKDSVTQKIYTQHTRATE